MQPAMRLPVRRAPRTDRTITPKRLLYRAASSRRNPEKNTVAGTRSQPYRFSNCRLLLYRYRCRYRSVPVLYICARCALLPVRWGRRPRPSPSEASCKSNRVLRASARRRRADARACAASIKPRHLITHIARATAGRRAYRVFVRTGPPPSHRRPHLQAAHSCRRLTLTRAERQAVNGHALSTQEEEYVYRHEELGPRRRRWRSRSSCGTAPALQV